MDCKTPEGDGLTTDILLNGIVTAYENEKKERNRLRTDVTWHEYPSDHPKRHGNYWTYQKNYGYQVAYWGKTSTGIDDDVWDDWDNGECDEVLAWQELPPPQTLYKGIAYER